MQISNYKLQIKIDPKETGNRVDKFLADYLKKNHPDLGISRSQLKTCIEQGNITVNNNNVSAKYILKPNDIVKINIVEKTPENNILPENIPLNIIYEDKDIIVINKPSNMVVHPAAGNPNNTLVNALYYHCGKLASLGLPNRPGIVHRLDKDTTGIIVCAKTDQSYLNLVSQFKNKQVQKQYIAIVEGQVCLGQKDIDLPIGRHVRNRKDMAIRFSGGKNAFTKYKVLYNRKDISVLRISILTGRTHQIRVHMSYIGHPVLGDTKYGHKSDLISRQALHAWRISFTHPVKDSKMEFEAKIPKDMLNVFEEYNIKIGVDA